MAVLYRHTDIEKNAMASLVCRDLTQHLPAVQICIALQEVVRTAITADMGCQHPKSWKKDRRSELTHLKLGSNSQVCALGLRDVNTLFDAIQIAFPVKRPLIE